MIASSVVLEKDVVIHQPDLVNLYGCRIGAGSRVGAFVEIQRNAVDRTRLQDLEPHLHLRRRDARGRRVRRPRRDVHQRPASARGESRRQPADRSGLGGRADAGEARAPRSAATPRLWLA